MMMLLYLLIQATAVDPFFGPPMCPMGQTSLSSSQLLTTSCQTIPGGEATPCGGDCDGVNGSTCCYNILWGTQGNSKTPKGCCLPGTYCCDIGWTCVWPIIGEECWDYDMGCCALDEDCCNGLGCTPKGDPNNQCCVGSAQFGASKFCENGSSCCGSGDGGDSWLCCKTQSESCCGSKFCCKSDELCCGAKCCRSGEQCCEDTCCKADATCCGSKCCPRGSICSANKECVPDSCTWSVGGRKFDLWPLSSQFKGNDTVLPDYKLEINPCGPLVGKRTEFCSSDAAICFEYKLVVGRWPPRSVALNDSSLVLGFEATTSRTDYVNITFHCANAEKLISTGNDYDKHWVEWYHPALCTSSRSPVQDKKIGF